MSPLVERVETNYPFEKDRLSRATVAPVFFSVSITYVSSWCWLTSTYLNILIWFSIEVLHHALHLQKKKLPLNKKLLHGRKFLPNSLRSHWLLRGHMTSNNETVSRQNVWAGNIAKSMTSEGNSARLPVVLIDDCSYSEVLWIFSYKISPQATLRFSGHKTVSLGTNQCLSVYYCGHGDCLVRENKNH